MPKNTEPRKQASPITRIRRDSIRESTKIELAVAAGGWCEFPGCRAYLMRHSVTHTPGNYAQLAHIVAFSPKGPRGNAVLPSSKLNDASNLMFLCAACHKLIDSGSAKYPVDYLKDQKAEHERRIHGLTSTRPDLQTKALVLKAKIAGQSVGITSAAIQDAVSPRYADHDPFVIDITGISDSPTTSYWDIAKQTIIQQTARLYDQPIDGNPIRHISVFALAPIPLLVCLGSALSSKVPTDLYQRHRDTEDWTWKSNGRPVSYSLKTVKEGTDSLKVALLLSLSGKIAIEDLPSNLPGKSWIYEITLSGVAPNPGFLATKQDLESFRYTYMNALRQIATDHVGLREIHLFPAVPAPVAVLCGRELLPKVDPALLIHDFHKGNDGFTPTIRINES
jgi:hypothetical protein